MKNKNFWENELICDENLNLVAGGASVEIDALFNALRIKSVDGQRLQYDNLNDTDKETYMKALQDKLWKFVRIKGDFKGGTAKNTYNYWAHDCTSERYSVAMTHMAVMRRVRLVFPHNP